MFKELKLLMLLWCYSEQLCFTHQHLRFDSEIFVFMGLTSSGHIKKSFLSLYVLNGNQYSVTNTYTFLLELSSFIQHICFNAHHKFGCDKKIKTRKTDHWPRVEHVNYQFTTVTFKKASGYHQQNSNSVIHCSRKLKFCMN